MSEKEKAVINLVEELKSCTLEEYAAVKPVLIAVSSGKATLLEFLEKAFTLVEKNQPLLIEMKGACPFVVISVIT